MSAHIPHATTHIHPTPFWRSRTGIALLAFLAIAIALLIAEHWAHLAGVLPLMLLLLLCGLMHLFMHGGHGHGGHDHSDVKKE
ncbi:MAG: DUF2933 domain-containing protein [Rhodospirillaceae bacterium]|nr:DUF2933 domain-containing protein [Rhodospirillales bacterium]